MKEKDEEIRAVRSQLAEARLALESVAEGADMATNEASEQLREADGRIQEAWAAKELVDAMMVLINESKNQIQREKDAERRVPRAQRDRVLHGMNKGGHIASA